MCLSPPRNGEFLLPDFNEYEKCSCHVCIKFQLHGMSQATFNGLRGIHLIPPDMLIKRTTPTALATHVASYVGMQLKSHDPFAPFSANSSFGLGGWKTKMKGWQMPS